MLQGHDAIRQRMEHILKSLAGVRENTQIEPGHLLMLERQQAKNVLEMVLTTGSRIKVELNAVIASAQGLAGDTVSRAAAGGAFTLFRAAAPSASASARHVGEAEYRRLRREDRHRRDHRPRHAAGLIAGPSPRRCRVRHKLSLEAK